MSVYALGRITCGCEAKKTIGWPKMQVDVIVIVIYEGNSELN